MLMRKFAATAALLIAAMGVAAGTVNAEAPAADVINATGEVVNGSAIVTTDAGSLVEEDGAFKIKAANGTTVAGVPTTVRIDEFEFPVAVNIAGNTATLTPELAMDKATYKPVALPYEDSAGFKTEYAREQAAWSRMTSTISMGATIGTLVGGLGGAAVGCIVGGATLAAPAGLLIPLLGAVPGFVAGCVVGATAFSALGAITAQIFVTAPVAIGAAIQYFTTITAPFTPAK